MINTLKKLKNKKKVLKKSKEEATHLYHVLIISILHIAYAMPLVKDK